MRHSMDFEDTCYYVDVIDDIVSDFVQKTWIKDELSELLKDEPSDELAVLIEEVSHQVMLTELDPT